MLFKKKNHSNWMKNKKGSKLEDWHVLASKLEDWHVLASKLEDWHLLATFS